MNDLVLTAVLGVVVIFGAGGYLFTNSRTVRNPIAFGASKRRMPDEMTNGMPGRVRSEAPDWDGPTEGGHMNPNR